MLNATFRIGMTDTSSPHQAHTRNWFRLFANPVTWIVFLGCAPLVALRTLPLFHLLAACDFSPYWAAGHLFLSRGNPYSSAAMFAAERATGWPYTRPLMMLCPPWELPVAGVFALTPYNVARFAWLVISVLLDCASAIALWTYFGGERRRVWVALAIVATFLPMATAEYIGQVTPLILASIAGFLLLERRKWDFAAGLMLLGFGIKPHLLYLVLLTVVLWAMQYRRWAVLAGAATGYCVATAAAFLYNPYAFDYLHNTWGPAMDTMTGLGGVLRHVFGVQHAWLQFLPTVAGILWFIVYWSRNRNQWNWRAHLPLLLLVSLCSAPYFWYHDFLLAAPALIFLAVKSEERLPLLLPAWLLVQCAILFCGGVSPALEAAAGVLWIGFYFYACAQRALYDAPLPVLESGSAL